MNHHARLVTILVISNLPVDTAATTSLAASKCCRAFHLHIVLGRTFFLQSLRQHPSIRYAVYAMPTSNAVTLSWLMPPVTFSPLRS